MVNPFVMVPLILSWILLRWLEPDRSKGHSYPPVAVPVRVEGERQIRQVKVAEDE